MKPILLRLHTLQDVARIDRGFSYLPPTPSRLPRFRSPGSPGHNRGRRLEDRVHRTLQALWEALPPAAKEALRPPAPDNLLLQWL